MPTTPELIKASMAVAMTPIPRPELDMTRLALPRPEIAPSPRAIRPVADPSVFARPGPHPLARFMRGPGPGQVATPDPTPAAPMIPTATTDAPETPMMNVTAPPEMPRPAPAAPPAPAFPIAEADHRRLDFLAEVPVTLADGQCWHLKKPRLRFGGRLDGAGKPGLKMMCAFGTEYDERVEAYYRTHHDDAPDEDEILARILAEVDLAVGLLLANYDLDYDQAGALVQFDFHADATESDRARRRVLLDTALGLAPKA